MDIQLFIENLDNLSHAEFDRVSAEATLSEISADRSACLSLCAMGIGDPDTAIRLAEDAINTDALSDFVSFACGLVRLKTGNAMAAVDPLGHVSKRFVKHRDARMLMATALLYADRFDEADAVASDVYDQDDEMRAALLGIRAQCAQARADERAARVLYREALVFAPRSEWVRRALRAQTSSATDLPNDKPEVVII